MLKSLHTFNYHTYLHPDHSLGVGLSNWHPLIVGMDKALYFPSNPSKHLTLNYKLLRFSIPM